MVSTLRKGRPRVGIPVGAGGFLFPKVPRIVPEAIKWVRVVFREGVRYKPKREVIHSPSYTAEFKDEWRYASASHVCLHDVNRDKFPSPPHLPKQNSLCTQIKITRSSHKPVRTALFWGLMQQVVVIPY